MDSPPLTQFDEADWHEKIRRRELVRCLSTLAQLAKNIQLGEDFANAAPDALARLIGDTRKR